MSDLPDIDFPEQMESVTRRDEARMLGLVAAAFFTWTAACVAAGYLLGSA